MPRLLRPHIPLEPRCRVALRQLGEIWPDTVIKENRGKYGRLLRSLLEQLATLLNCELGHLDLDHNPALALREKVMRKGVHIGYRPDANDPEYLIYRERRDHVLKTQVRGEGAQFPDRVLIKRERRRAKSKPAPIFLKSKNENKIKNRKSKWAKRPFPKGRKFNADSRPDR